MKKTYRITILIIFALFMPNSILGAERRAETAKQEQAPEKSNRRREQARQMETMRNKLAEFRQAARKAENQDRPEEARDLREKAAQLVEKIRRQTQRAAQRQLREADEYLERLRKITREAEEIREKIIIEIEHREKAWMEPERELSLRPRVQKRVENVHNVINQIRETFMRQLERIEATFGGLWDNMAQMETEILELRAENKRLRNQLRERNESRRQRDRDIPARRDAGRPIDEGKFTVP
jgi:chromosome segregation ATPase